MSAAISRMMGHLVRRAVAALALTFFALIAVYHFTVAGVIALDGQFGTLDARLIVGGIYAALALISLAVLCAMGRKPADARAPVLSSSSNPREMQLVMLVEAVMLGYALARKRERAS